MKFPFRPELLNNQYIGMRHGISKANEQGVIACRLDRETQNDGLTSAGIEQVRESAKAALEKGILNKGTLIYSSQFQRCRETAQIVAEEIGTEMVRYIDLLNERDFGSLYGKSDHQYQEVWSQDALDQSSRPFGAQAVQDVHRQNIQLFEDMESRYFHKRVLFVAHGDRLNIMTTIFQHVKPHEHRSLPWLWRQAEIRPFNP